jgi:DNA-binding FadR family transcriptional regulator
MTTPAPARLVPRPVADVHAKRAAKVADLIVDDVMALGWPVGKVLGSETDLLARYHVSRAVFREAVRLVEHQQVARTRRGPGGGLVVTEPTIGAVKDAVVLYLHRVGATLDEIFETRIILEEIACELAAARTEEADLPALGRFADGQPLEPHTDARDLHALVAALSRNAGLELLVDVFHQVAQLYAPDRPRLDRADGRESARAHAGIAEAVMAGDPGRARSRMREHLQTEVAVFRHRRSTRQLLPDSVVLAESVQGKGAEAVARSITRTVVTQNLQPGDLVGTEPELIVREGVSRALLREAVRLLEYHHIARMRRGPGGGLFVMAPGADAVTETAAIYLARHGMQVAQLAELRTRVEVALADLAAQRIDAEGTALLRQALRREGNATGAERVESVHDLHVAVAASVHNGVLELVALVLIRMSALHQGEGLAGRRHRNSAEVFRTHEGIAAAIESGDRELARHRMRCHLQALGALRSGSTRG